MRGDDRLEQPRDDGLEAAGGLGADHAVEVARSEEELVIAQRAVARERVRLVKRVVTETVTTTTEIRREELHVERLPLDAPQADVMPSTEASAGGESAPPGIRGRFAPLLQRLRPGSSASIGPAFEDGVQEIVLMEEQVQVTKRVVPRERVRLRKEVVRLEREVQDSVRKEQVTVEGAAAPLASSGDPDAAAP